MSILHYYQQLKFSPNHSALLKNLGIYFPSRIAFLVSFFHKLPIPKNAFLTSFLKIGLVVKKSWRGLGEPLGALEYAINWDHIRKTKQVVLPNHFYLK